MSEPLSITPGSSGEPGRGRPRRRGWAIAGAAAVVLVASGVVLLWEPVLGKAARQRRHSRSNMQVIASYLTGYAEQHGNTYPPATADWQQKIMDWGALPERWFHAPAAAPGQVSYFYFSTNTARPLPPYVLLENIELAGDRDPWVVDSNGNTYQISREKYMEILKMGLPMAPSRPKPAE